MSCVGLNVGLNVDFCVLRLILGEATLDLKDRFEVVLPQWT